MNTLPPLHAPLQAPALTHTCWPFSPPRSTPHLLATGPRGASVAPTPIPYPRPAQLTHSRTLSLNAPPSTPHLRATTRLRMPKRMPVLRERPHTNSCTQTHKPRSAPPRRHALEDAEQHVGVEGALVCLIHNHHAVVVQVLVDLRAGGWVSDQGHACISEVHVSLRSTGLQ